jgi:acyl-CoA synthetase (NDP forming)
MPDLARLLRPKSVAVFGGAWAREVIRQLKRMDFAGDIWPVHPDKSEIEGLRAYASIVDLPQAPDASFIGVNRHQTIDLVGGLAARGAGGAVCFASGFSETGDTGAALQAALVEAAGDMAVLGPNCYGFINALDGALLWPDLHGCERVARGLAFVTQSSNIAINLTMARRALPIGYVVCLGNQAVTSLDDAILGLAADDRVSVIGLHIEGLTDPARFARAVHLARTIGKPVIALRVGRSDAAKSMAMSHTASLAGGSAAMAAFLRRVGVAEVETIPAFIEAAKLLHVLGPLPGGGLVTLSCSGGEASLLADSADRARVAMPAFPPDVEAVIRTTVNSLVTVSNPFDYHTFDWGNRARLVETFKAVMAGPQAITGLVLDFPKAELGPAEGWDSALDAMSEASAHARRPAAVIATVPECLPEDRARRLVAAGTVPLMGVAEAMTAIRVASDVWDYMGLPLYRPLPIMRRSTSASDLLDEAAGKALLAGYGVPIPEGRLCRTEDDIVSAVAAFGPAAIKAVGGHIAHKTEIGAVVLNVRDAAAARDAYARLSALAGEMLVERMVADVVAELIVGAVRDPALGLMMLIGAGGVFAELIDDTVLLTLPLDAEEVACAIDGLKIAKVLKGWRGKPAADRDALVATIVAIGRFIEAHAEMLAELDINPLMVTTTGAVAADALIRLID